jgi:hypothetical protein
MPTVTQDISRAIIVTAFLVSGLAIDQYVPFWGQLLVSIAAWTLLLYWISVAPREQQVMLYTCVAYATLGECFLSLVWGLYDYRLGNIPAFVPPGHALLLVLGLIITARTPDWVTWVVPGVALPCVALLAWIGVDTFGVLLFSLIALCMVFNRSRKLYAVMFVLSLTMEIYGTWIGNWAWRVDVPWIGLTTTNHSRRARFTACSIG